MKDLKITGYRDEYYMPSVHFEAETGICSITGESYLDDAAGFYDQLLSWLKKYIKEVNKPVELNVKLKYFNSSSYKRLFEILHILKVYEKEGGKVTVKWYFEEEDHELQEEVEDLKAISHLDIQFFYNYMK